MSETRVLVSLHARQRALERSGIGATLVAREVTEALEAGRISVREPVWTCPDGNRHRADRTRAGAQRGTARWAWPPDKTRAYLVAKKRGLWVVVTVVVRRGDAGELAA